MRRTVIALAAAPLAAMPAAAQTPPAATPAILPDGTLLDVNAEGKSTRVPDLATIRAGVVTQAATAAAALSENAARMDRVLAALQGRSEEHTSELQSLMRISYAVFCLKKKHLTVSSHNSHNN